MTINSFLAQKEEILSSVRTQAEFVRAITELRSLPPATHREWIPPAAQLRTTWEDEEALASMILLALRSTPNSSSVSLVCGYYGFMRRAVQFPYSHSNASPSTLSKVIASILMRNPNSLGFTLSLDQKTAKYSLDLLDPTSPKGTRLNLYDEHVSLFSAHKEKLDQEYAAAREAIPPNDKILEEWKKLSATFNHKLEESRKEFPWNPHFVTTLNV